MIVANVGNRAATSLTSLLVAGLWRLSWVLGKSGTDRTRWWISGKFSFVKAGLMIRKQHVTKVAGINRSEKGCILSMLVSTKIVVGGSTILL